MQCPTCRKSVDDSTVGQPGSTFPFCSERCKLIDLGRWLSDAYQIPAEPSDDEQDEAPPEVWIDPDAKKKR
jgi:uncharacterized protein